MKFATMDALAVTEYDKGFVVPVTSPDHPENTNPSAAVAVRVIVVFWAYEPPRNDSKLFETKKR